MEFYGEENLIRCFCARCNKELTSNKFKNVLSCSNVTLRKGKNGEYKRQAILGNPYDENGYYLCEKCTKELVLFMKNQLPNDVSDKTVIDDVYKIKNLYAGLMLFVCTTLNNLKDVIGYSVEDFTNILGVEREETIQEMSVKLEHLEDKSKLEKILNLIYEKEKQNSDRQE